MAEVPPTNNERLRPLRSTRPSTGGPRTGADALSDEFVAHAARRLGYVVAFYGLAYLAATLPGLAMRLAGAVRGVPFSESLGVPGTVIPLWLLCCAAFYFALRSEWMNARRSIETGLVFEVVGSLMIVAPSFWEHATTIDWETFRPAEVTWVGVFIIICAVVLPASRMQTAVAALLAAVSSPIAIVATIWLQAVDVPTDRLLFLVGLMLQGNLICAAVAYGLSRVVYGLGVRLKKAEDFGAYRLTERIGAGGMGEVWRAEHQMLPRPAAIKLILPDKLGDSGSAGMRESSARFRREAEVIASLRSPHTVQLYDFGIAEDNSLFYVMELLDGVDLERLVKEHGPLGPARTAHLMIQACHSLSEAHDAGMIHRDIKPANLFTCRLGLDVDFVKVLDFGLVKQRTAQSADLTAKGIAAGTPAYLSPEMIVGDELDGRSDLYSLGCVAYWLLTGRRVFDYDKILKVVVAHANEAPTPPSVVSEFEVPEAIDAIVLRCLAKDAGDRFQSASDLADALETFAGDHPWSPQQARSWWDAHLPSVDSVHGRRSNRRK